MIPSKTARAEVYMVSGAVPSFDHMSGGLTLLLLGYDLAASMGAVEGGVH
jgi:hypothetical protein